MEKALKLFVVARFENGWDYAPSDRILFFMDKKEATATFKEMVKDSEESLIRLGKFRTGDSGRQHKICLAQVEPGKEIYFSGYGTFEGGKLIKEYDSSFMQRAFGGRASGDIVSASNIASKTTTTDQRIINQVISAVKSQVKYSK